MANEEILNSITCQWSRYFCTFIEAERRSNTSIQKQVYLVMQASRLVTFEALNEIKGIEFNNNLDLYLDALLTETQIESNLETIQKFIK